MNLPTHGNYYGYYAKRPFLNDERLSVLPAHVLEGKRVLDVGCNEGWVSCEIAQIHGAKFVVGIDIDDKLVQGAWRRRRAVWSTQAPCVPEARSWEDQNSDEVSVEDHLPSSTSLLTEDGNGSKKRKRDQVDSEAPRPADRNASILSGTSATTKRPPKPDYFPASCEHEFGSLPIPPSANRGKEVFPHNLAFRTADWVNTTIPEDTGGYDVVVAFSLSKWIHLNEGDEGLKRFFKRVYKVLKSGGTFVLEPQPWESYVKARKMDRKLQENYKNLRIRPADFETILKEIGFGPATHLGTIGDGGFHRPIDLYVKP
ncbi:hypothetical protein NLJ89_g11234 [Agrocybe chaxingu]|uniref:RNA methyltransferase n=1 Tax=Agrocybe chaxingu TaxID=84603 RepID=A0A9W8JQB2_9AGAR|nr:hypothetical protein NLJ89_g11234 [Agrocybe chaxingu]